MSYYKYHAFVCTNQRNDGRKCCADGGAAVLREYAKARIKELEENGRGKVRVNASGCLDRCGKGPVMVVYPGEAWYAPKSKEDIEEIIQEHLISGNVVSRLLLD